MVEILTEPSVREKLAALSMEPVGNTPEQFAAHLAEWHAAGACDGFDVLPAVLSIDLGVLVDAVVPLLRQRGLVRLGYDSTTLRGHLGLQRAQSRFAA